MPEISRFLGIVIAMYFNVHNPPHFHSSYEQYRALTGIEPLKLRAGNTQRATANLKHFD